MKITELPLVVWKSIQAVWKYAKGLLIGLFVVGSLTSLLPLIQVRILGDLVNQLTKAVEAGGFPIVLLVIYASIWGLARVSSDLQMYFDQKMSIEVSNKLELEKMRRAAALDVAKHEDPEFQDLVQRGADRGIWPIINTVDSTLFQFSNLVVLIAAIVVAASMNWLVFLAIVICLIPTLHFQLRYGRAVYCIWMVNSPLQRQFMHLRSHLSHKFSLIQSKTLQSSESLLDRSEKILDKFRDDQYKALRSRTTQMIAANLIAIIGFVIALVLIVRDVQAGRLLVGDMVFLIGAIGYFVGSLNTIFSSLSRQYEHGLIANDLFKILEEEPIIRRPENPTPLHLNHSPEIEFRNVWFKYPGTDVENDKWILKGVNLTIRKGKKIALVGENGAGKTTLIKLLARIYDPTKGDIFVDGVNLRSVDPEEWGQYLAILFQEYRTHDFTVDEAIAMGRSTEAVDAKRVQHAANLASAHDFIAGWKNTYRQQLGREFEGGIDPSQGQRQKLAIARTIYRDGQVLVFDEPTSSVDALSEARMFREIEQITSGKTLFLISHRFNTVKSADRILVIEDGRVVEDGSHSELIKDGGLYAKMFHEQAESYLDVVTTK